MKALTFLAPAAYMEALQLQAEMTNLPTVGVPSNVAFPTLQGNLSGATKRYSSTFFMLRNVSLLILQFFSRARSSLSKKLWSTTY